MLIATTFQESFAAEREQAVKVRRSRSRERSRAYSLGEAPSDIVDRVRRFVLANLGLKPRASAIVGALGVSESRLRRAVLAATGLTLGGLVLELKLLQARSWLSSNRESRSQGEIVAALGFASAASFSRAYGRRFGESMTATRRRAVSGSAPQPALQDNGDARLDVMPCKSLSVQGL
ncbi:helix-turn-helix domain-containing protein [Caulobacter soli]|uniref:helix-turn-helix domain-containing protein n=1 Tax=Caulobacter soli TaxID=2708539 RepID=UPI0013EE2F30|nr:AraC family transcriptional regulator [Caulobacter soli]